MKKSEQLSAIISKMDDLETSLTDAYISVRADIKGFENRTLEPEDTKDLTKLTEISLTLSMARLHVMGAKRQLISTKALLTNAEEIAPDIWDNVL